MLIFDSYKKTIRCKNWNVLILTRHLIKHIYFLVVTIPIYIVVRVYFFLNFLNLLIVPYLVFLFNLKFFFLFI